VAAAAAVTAAALPGGQVPPAVLAALSLVEFLMRPDLEIQRYRHVRVRSGAAAFRCSTTLDKFQTVR
jgi:hypothetical protein